MSDSVRKNALPTAISLFLHAALLGGIFYWEQHRPVPPKVEEIKFVEAKLVSLKPKVKDSPKEDTRKIVKTEVKKVEEREEDVKSREDLERKAAAEQLQQDTEKQVKEAAEKQQKEAEAKAQEEFDFRRKQEELKKQKEAEEKTKAEAKAAEEKAKADEIAKQQEEKRKQQDLEKSKKIAQQKKQEEITKAKIAQEKRVQAEQAEENYASFLSIMSDRFKRRWSTPPSARNGMFCVVRINFLRTGRITDVEIVQSSGDEAFDRSAVQAVKSTDTIKELREMDVDMFEKYFQVVDFRFAPNDLRLNLE